jgi:hypothetical protein
MSRAGVAAFLVRVMEDEGFRNELKASPEATLAQFDLTPDEVAAIKSADPSKIQELGVDERVSKAAAVDRLLPDASSSTDFLLQTLKHIPWISR